MKHFKKKTITALRDLIKPERERFSKINDVVEKLQANGRFLPKNLTDSVFEVKENINKDEMDIIDLKGKIDFIYIYLYKYLDEKNLSKKDEYVDDYKFIENEINNSLKERDKKSLYEIYNKKAGMYNATISMPMLSLFAKRNNEHAPLI